MLAHRVKVVVPIPMDEAGVANRRAQLTDVDIAPGYEVDFVAVDDGAALGDGYFDAALMDFSVLRAGLRAQQEGYDALCIDTVSDSGLYALRSALTIPVLGPGQTSFHLACTLGKKFTVLTMWRPWFHLYEKLFSEYHLWDRVASIRHIDTRPSSCSAADRAPSPRSTLARSRRPASLSLLGWGAGRAGPRPSLTQRAPVDITWRGSFAANIAARGAAPGFGGPGPSLTAAAGTVDGPPPAGFL